MEGSTAAQQLYDEGQYQSCVQLCNLWREEERGYEVALLMGDALVQLRQHRRALLTYRGMLEGDLNPREAASVSTKAAACCVKLGGDEMDAEATRLLAAIPPESRGLSATLLLAQLKRKKASARSASQLYLAALQANPFCLEAITGYIESSRIAQLSQGGGASSTALQTWKTQMETLLRYYTEQLPAKMGASAGPALSRVTGWLRMQLSKATADYVGMRQIARELAGSGGGSGGGGAAAAMSSPYVMADIAESYYRVGRLVEAAALFKTIRTYDPCFTYGMDVYSTLLKNTGQMEELRSLADSLVDAAPETVEAWLVASVARSVSPAPDDVPMQYALKSVALSGGQSSRAFSYIASLLLTLEHMDNAVYFYQKALGLAKELPTYQGIVKAHIKGKDGRTALALAKEATQLFPNCASAWALIGLVYHGAQRYEQAKGHYETALKLDAQCTEALLHLCDLDCDERKYSTAIGRLTNAMPSDLVLLKLGTVFTSIHQYCMWPSFFFQLANIFPPGEYHYFIWCLTTGSLDHLILVR